MECFAFNFKNCKIFQIINLQVHVPQPYPVERIVEKKVPYPVEKIVEKRVKFDYLWQEFL